MQSNQFPIGGNQVIVVYESDDTGNELDPYAIYSQIAADAAVRANQGWRLISLASTALRHAQAYVGRSGSGYETSAAIAVVYAIP
jgi:hypothetical protein